MRFEFCLEFFLAQALLFLLVGFLGFLLFLGSLLLASFVGLFALGSFLLVVRLSRAEGGLDLAGAEFEGTEHGLSSLEADEGGEVAREVRGRGQLILGHAQAVELEEQRAECGVGDAVILAAGEEGDLLEVLVEEGELRLGVLLRGVLELRIALDVAEHHVEPGAEHGLELELDPVEPAVDLRLLLRGGALQVEVSLRLRGDETADCGRARDQLVADLEGREDAQRAFVLQFA